jgi:hypothetical protein
MITRSQAKLAAAAAADALRNQPFRFLDLPKELRLMIYEELMDNRKNNVRFTAPAHLDVDQVYIDDMFYPNLLRVSKLVRKEYWPLCLRESSLWVTYEIADDLPDEQSGEGNERGMPYLSDWLEIPTEVLDRITEVIFKFTAEYVFPKVGKSDSICIICSPSTGS